jgi:hypothetical protein
MSSKLQTNKKINSLYIHRIMKLAIEWASVCVSEKERVKWRIHIK